MRERMYFALLAITTLSVGVMVLDGPHLHPVASAIGALAVVAAGWVEHAQGDDRETDAHSTPPPPLPRDRRDR